MDDEGALIDRLAGDVAARLRAAGADADRIDVVDARVRRRAGDALAALTGVYGEQAAAVLGRCLEVVADIAVSRAADLRRLDLRREVEHDWFQSERQLGYVCYVDRFAGTLRGIEDHLDHLRDLGVTYLHLMPLLAPRDGEDDGGYAVVDYRAVDPRLGDVGDLRHLAGRLRAEGMSLCVDLVVNHTAREHEWARKAAGGDPRYRAYYRIFADRELPDRFERTLPEVFPDTAPGSFTWFDEVQGWVWTTFHDYQWDLNYENPEVFVELLAVMGHLANLGVEVLRLDAVPFLWKREGTSCQNQPEAHLLLQAWRALTRMAAPALLFKAEAIVPPGELVPYLGGHEPLRDECDLAYHNQLMVMLWSAAAARDARLSGHALAQMRPPPAWASWCTYVRGHDDIGWAVTDEDAAAVGWDGFAHRRFLADFYAGAVDGSFARGSRFQENPWTGDARTSGMTAALCGITQARELGDAHLMDQAIRRLLLLYGVAASYGGLPLLYMGDEIALGDDPHWADDPEQAHDSRWQHRPPMDWAAAARRHEPGSVEHRVFEGLRRLFALRASTPQLRAGGTTRPLPTDHDAVLAYLREHPRTGRLLALASFADDAVSIDPWVLGAAGLHDPVDVLSPDLPVHDSGGRIPIPRLGMRWLVAR